MCSVCLQTPCHPRCSNAPDPRVVKACCKCGVGIFEGEKYLTTAGGCVCEECLEELSVNEWLEIMGESLETAEREDL